MSGGISDIARRYEPICPELFFKAEVPLGNLHVRRVIVQLVYRGVKRPWRITWKTSPVWQGEWISTGKARPGIFKIHIAPNDPWGP